MLIYTHIITPRCKYIFGLIFTDNLGITFRLTDNIQDFNEYSGEKISYGRQRIADEVFIPSTSLLFEKSVIRQNPEVFIAEDYPAFFKTEDGDFPFDIFAASFYLVTRYEEYYNSEKDKYGRYQAKNSLAYKNNFLQKPVINIWVKALKTVLSQKYRSLTFRKHQFSPLISFDIDVAFAYKGRGILRNVATSLKDILSGRLKRLRSRLSVLSGQVNDPFDSFEYIKTVIEKFKLPVIFFFLVKKTPTKYDRNLSPFAKTLRELIVNISTAGMIGIHPSYYSSENKKLLADEKLTLEDIAGKVITRSRQHYLRFSLPGTYVNLTEAGIKEDYSMGYAEIPGFRAGIAGPFKFYNLVKDETTNLVVHPVTFMDGSFIEDLQLTPADSIQYIKMLVEEVKRVNGELLCIWHNHTVSNAMIYKGWQEVFETTLEMAKENNL
jgi:hypothetical protein